MLFRSDIDDRLASGNLKLGLPNFKFSTKGGKIPLIKESYIPVFGVRMAQALQSSAPQNNILNDCQK